MIKSFSKRAKLLQKLASGENPTGKGLPAAEVERILVRLALLDSMESLDDLLAWPGLHCHKLTGDKKGRWAIRVTGNKRLTFVYNEEEGNVYELDYEDYH